MIASRGRVSDFFHHKRSVSTITDFSHVGDDNRNELGRTKTVGGRDAFEASLNSQCGNMSGMQGDPRVEKTLLKN